jgi:Fic-DOC domain mobile mystery protein B
VTDLFDIADGQTKLTAEECRGLKPSYISFRHELNQVEQENIARARQSLFGARRPRDPLGLVDQGFICATHRKMYGDVWDWAGSFRQSDRNIGVDFYKIHTEMRMFIDDVRYWVEHQTYASDELAVRFHHRLVWIHPFPNGNGRLSRLMGDLLVTKLGQPAFSWGSLHLTDANSMRASYVAALQQADQGDLGPLITFARS